MVLCCRTGLHCNMILQITFLIVQFCYVPRVECYYVKALMETSVLNLDFKGTDALAYLEVFHILFMNMVRYQVLLT